MRILLLHSRPLDFATAVGGVPEFLKAITYQFSQLGVDVMIYAGHKSFSKIEQTATVHETVKIYSGPIVEPAFWLARRNLRQVMNFCRQENISLLHAHGTYTPGFMVREIAKRTGLPYVLTSHSDISAVNSDRIKRRTVRDRYRVILHDAKWVTHLTPAMEKASHHLYDTSKKSTLIHNGIDVDLWRPYQILPERNYLLGIGRLERGKGFHVLLDMYAKMLERGANTSLVIAGTGEAETDLFSQCESLGLRVCKGMDAMQSLPERSVIFTGYVRGEDKQKLIGESKGVLFATQPDLWEEAFGLVQLEGMAAGKPLIASDIDAVRYLSELGMQALIVPPKDIDQWAQAAMNLLADDKKRLTMGAKNAAAVEAFNWRSIAEQYSDVYQKCLA